MTQSTLSRVQSKHSSLIHCVLIPLLIDPQRFWQIYSKATNLFERAGFCGKRTWSRIRIIEVWANHESVQAYIVPTVWQNKRRAGMQVSSIKRSVSVCVRFMKIMRLNLPVSFFPVYFFLLWAHCLDCVRSPGLAFCCDSTVANGLTSTNHWKKKKKAILLHTVKNLLMSPFKTL